MRSKTRMLSEGAMMCALSALVFFLNKESAGMLDYMLFWILPLPLLVFTLRYGANQAWLCYVSMLVLSFLFSLPQSVFYTAMGGLVGIVYGSAMRKGWSGGKLLLVSCSFSVLSSFTTMYVFAAFFGYDLVSELHMLSATLQEFSAFIPTAVLHQVEGMLPAFISAVNVLTGIVEGVLIHLLATVLVLRLRLRPKAMPPMKPLRLSKVAGWILLFAFCGLSFLLTASVLPQLQFLLLFLYLSVIFILIGNGYLSLLAILSYYNMKRGLLLLILLVLFPPTAMLIAVVGIVDAVSDFRYRMTVKKKG